MSENKRVFQIKINGISESVEAVKALKDQLKDVEGIIKNLQNAEVKVKVSGGDTVKTKVSSGKTSVSGEDKAALELEKQKTKQLELQNDAIREQLLQTEQLKQANKEVLDSIKEQAKGYSEVNDEGVKEYSNTLNGLSAQLKAIKKELRNTDMGSDEFKQLTEQANELNQKLKDAEAAYGQFGRNVGNYFNDIIDALQEWDDSKDGMFNLPDGMKGSLNDLKQQLKELQGYWSQLSPDDANFDKTAKAIKSLTNQIQDMESKLKSAGDAANTSFTGRFTTTIGGVEASFSNASEACEALRKKLVAMRVAGEQNTPMYQEIIQLTRRLQKEVSAANKEVEGMTNTTRNIGKVVGVLKGLSGIASLGQGIAGLFGGKSEELDKMIQKFTSLTLVLNGLTAIEEELTKGSSSFAKFVNMIGSGLDTIMNKSWGLKEFSGTITAMNNTLDKMNAEKALGGLSDAVASLLPSLQSASDRMMNMIQSSTELNDAFNNLSRREKMEFFNASSLDDLKDGSVALQDFGNKLKEAADADADFMEAMNELFSLQKKAVDINKQQREETEKLTVAENNLSGVTGRASKAIMGLASNSKVAAVGFKALAVSIKAFMTSTVILGILLALGEAIEWTTKRVKGLWKWLKSLFGIMNDDSAKKLASDIDDLQKKLDTLKGEYEIQIKLGNMGEVEAQIKEISDRLASLTDISYALKGNDEMNEWMENMVSSLDKQSKQWDKLNDQEKKAADTMQKLSKIASTDPQFFIRLQSLSPDEKLEKMKKALGGNVDGLNAMNAVLSQSDDAIEKFLDKLSDIDYDLNDIGVEGVKAFGMLGKGIQDARSQISQHIARIRQDINNLTKSNYSLRLSLDATDFEARMGQLKLEMAQMATQYGLFFGNDGKVHKNGGGRMNSTQQQIAPLLEENYKLQKQAAEKADKDAKAQKAKQAQQEAKSRADEAKRAAEDAKKRARAEANSRIEAMKEGFEKEMAMLKQKRKEELEDATTSGKDIEAINTIYDRQELELKKKYAKFIEDEEREHRKRLMDIAQNFLSEWKEINRQIEDTEADTSLGKSTNKQKKTSQSLSYDINGSVEDIQEYYNKMRDAQIAYINEKEKLDKESAEREHNRQIEDEDARFNSLAKSYRDELDEQERALKEKVESGHITQEMADKELLELNELYNKQIEDAEIQHAEKVQSIMEHGEEVLTTIQLEALEDRQSANADALNKQYDAIKDSYDKIEKLMERYQKRNTNSFGFISYEDYRKSLDDAVKATEEAAEQIKEQKDKLQKALDNNEISFDDFQKASKELDEFNEDLKDKLKDLKDNLGNSLNTWLQGVLDNVSKYTSVLSGMFDTISEMYTRELDAQEAALDKKQELLDKELDMIEEKLQKQQEITEEYSDKINDTEDELKNARGDRRQALIDQLAAQKKAQEESMAAEKKITEEKKKNAEKQEALKKQQDALDKKRKEQEKKSAIVQATINTFTAVSNALAVQPWAVGLALSAVALGLGMANVAQIASQKYASGGLLNGKSHAQGGMRIQGTNIEVEGGEYVTNKRSTAANLPLLEYVNANRRTLTREDLMRFYDNGNTSLINRSVRHKFAEGGTLPQLNVDVEQLRNQYRNDDNNRPVQVAVVDIINEMDNVNRVRVLAGDTDND